jgi:hypothetical protein
MTGGLSSDNIVPFQPLDSLSRFVASPLVIRHYGGANAERLAIYEREYGVRFSDSYRRF